MRKEYIKPDFSGETFTPNHRIASCGYNIVGNWSDITFRCEVYTSGGSHETACADGNEHNESLGQLKRWIEQDYGTPFASAASCTNVISTIEQLKAMMIGALDTHDAGNWELQEIHLPGGVKIPGIIARNPSGNHVADIAGYNIYEDAFTS